MVKETATSRPGGLVVTLKFYFTSVGPRVRIPPWSVLWFDLQNKLYKNGTTAESA